MGKKISKAGCPKCGFKHYMNEVCCMCGNEHICCYRCGYTEVKVIRNKEQFSKPVIKQLRRGGGIGCFIYRHNGAKFAVFGCVTNGVVETLKAELDAMAECRYTFKKKGQWFIRDLISNKTMPYSYKAFIG